MTPGAATSPEAKVQQTSQPREVRRISVVGGGLAGALMATYLARDGYEVKVFERRPDIRKAEIVRGRSINLALSTRGIHALEGVGLAEKVLSHAVPMRGRMMHSVDGELTFQPYGKDDSQVIHSVSRAGLNQLLLDEAEAAGAQLFFEERCLDVDLDNSTMRFRNAAGEEHVEEADLILGSDGAFSAVRARMQRTDRFTYSQTYLEHGYKELTIPPGDGGTFAIEKNALHIWPRHSYMMIALPNEDGSFTCTLFWPLEGPHGFDSLKTREDVERYFQRWFPDAVPLIPDLVDAYLASPPSSLVTIRCYPWAHKDRIALIGDAAHAVVPFYGQGMNCAFEDCAVLIEKVRESAPDWGRVLQDYQVARKENADALAELAIHNFLVMRDKVTSPLFLWRKKIEKRLDRMFPSFLPVYSMVTFSRIPYAEAQSMARKQDRIWQVAGIVAALLFLVLVLWFIF